MDNLTFSQRSTLTNNLCAKKIFRLLDKKQTNLCASCDLTKANEILHFANLVGPYICILKTHVDIIEDFSPDFLHQLTLLSKKHEFLLFEDRKFADIGSTVKLQYEKGIYKIADWADIINAHVLPGNGVIKALQETGLKNQRALLLLAQMSSEGNLITDQYTQKVCELAEQYSDFVIGFISQQIISPNPAMLTITPGVKLYASKDELGQKYTPIKDVMLTFKSDIFIVGRDLYEDPYPAKKAETYKTLGWSLYEQR